MATETDTSVASWSPETLKQLFAALHNDLKESVAERLTDIGKRDDERWLALTKEIQAVRSVLETRLDGMDKASTILSENVNRVPTILDREIARLTSLTDEKFSGVQRQFAERDVRSDANQKAADTAVNAALSAQKEAVAQQNAAYAAAGAKTEATTTKQIDSIVALLGSQSSGLNDKITSINARLDRDAGSHAGSSATTTSIVTIVAVVIALLGVGINFVNQRTTPPPQQISVPAR